VQVHCRRDTALAVLVHFRLYTVSVVLEPILLPSLQSHLRVR
jgi:hypothetical protein